MIMMETTQEPMIGPTMSTPDKHKGWAQGSYTSYSMCPKLMAHYGPSLFQVLISFQKHAGPTHTALACQTLPLVGKDYGASAL